MPTANFMLFSGTRASGALTATPTAATMITALAAVYKQPPDKFDWAFTKKDNYRDPNGLPDLAMMQRNVDEVKKLGFIKSSIDVAHCDMSIAETQPPM